MSWVNSVLRQFLPNDQIYSFNNHGFLMFKIIKNKISVDIMPKESESKILKDELENDL